MAKILAVAEVIQKLQRHLDQALDVIRTQSS